MTTDDRSSRATLIGEIMGLKEERDKALAQTPDPDIDCGQHSSACPLRPWPCAWHLARAAERRAEELEAIIADRDAKIARLHGALQPYLDEHTLVAEKPPCSCSTCVVTRAALGKQTEPEPLEDISDG